MHAAGAHLWLRPHVIMPPCQPAQRQTTVLHCSFCRRGTVHAACRTHQPAIARRRHGVGGADVTTEQARRDQDRGARVHLCTNQFPIPSANGRQTGLGAGVSGLSRAGRRAGAARPTGRVPAAACRPGTGTGGAMRGRRNEGPCSSRSEHRLAPPPRACSLRPACSE